MAEAQFHVVCIFINFLFAMVLREAIRNFGGTESLNEKVALIQERNRRVIETGNKYASSTGTRSTTKPRQHPS